MPTDAERIEKLEMINAVYKEKINELVQALTETRLALRTVLPAFVLKEGVGTIVGDLGKPVHPLP